MMSLCRDLFVDVGELQEFDVGGLTLGTLIRAHRVISVMRFAIAPFLAGQLKATPGLVAQSLVPVFRREALLALFAFTSDSEKAEVILNLLTWKAAAGNVFDAMYQPLIEARSGWYMVPINILGSADLCETQWR
jgi:hypothetical protein